MELREPLSAAESARSATVVRLAAITIACFVAQGLGLSFIDPVQHVAAVWPASGVAVAALLLEPRRLWRAVVGSVFVAALAANLLSGSPLLSSLGFAVANALECSIAALLLTGNSRGEVAFTCVADVVRLVAAATVAAAGSALLGATTTALHNGAPFWAAASMWWVADALGLLLIVPLIVSWARSAAPDAGGGRSRAAEAAAFAGLWAVAVFAVYHGVGVDEAWGAHRYMLIPLLAWAALRLGRRGVTTAMLLLAVVAIGGAIAGVGAFAGGAEGAIGRVLTVQIYLGITAVTGLLLSASHAEARSLARAAREGQASLGALSDNLPDGVVYQVVREQDGTLRLAYISAGVERLHGLAVAAVLSDPRILFDQLVAEDQSAVAAAAAASQATLGVLDIVVRARRADGELRFMRISGSPRRLADGRTVWDGIETDITGLREAQAESLRAGERLRLALEAARMGTWEWDAATGRVEWSDQVEPLFGLPGGSFARTYEAYLRLLHPDDRTRVEQKIAAMGTSGSSGAFEVEHRIVWPDGSVRWLGATGRARRDGGSLYMAGTVADITERRRAELESKIANDARLAGEALLRQFIKHSPAAVAMFDTEIRYLHVSERWLTDYHLEGQDVIGMSHYDVFPDIPERWKEVHRRVLAGAVERCDEDPFPRSDGGMEWLQWEVRPWRNADGDIGGIIMFTQVITDRMRAAEALVRSENRFRTLIENASDMVVAFNRKGDVLFQSPSSQQTLGFSPDEILGRNLRDLLHPDDLPAAVAALRRADSDSAHPTTARLRLRHRDGTWRLVEGAGRSVPGESPDGYIVINARDITESTLLQEQLRQAQKLESLGTLAGGIAHDFNNILGAIVAYAGLAQVSNPDNAELLDYMDQVLTASRRATNLVRQILSFSRQQKPQRRTMSIAPVLREALDLLRATLPASIGITQHVTPDLPEVLADATQIHQVVMNLGTNAAHAMKGRGELLVTLDRLRLRVASQGLAPGEYVRLTVRDTGSGMDTQTVGRIFDPFFTTKAPGEGTGLGLAVVHGIVKEHEGVITVSSERGRGSTFSVYLPVAAGGSGVDAMAAARHAPGKGQGVLFVDDEPMLCEVASRMLSRAGYAPLTCRSAEEALGALQERPGAFAVVVSDLTMPGMSGLELARKLATQDPGLPIILTSGYVDPATAESIKQMPIRQVLSKPFDQLTLTSAVAAALAERRA